MKKSNDMVAQYLGNFVAHFMSILVILMKLKVMYFVSLVDILQVNVSE
jgi:hypothetical protein